MSRDGLEKELCAARTMRTYCTLTGSSEEDAGALIDALEPIDDPNTEITPTHLTELRRAMTEVCKGIDEFTLMQILEGNSPVGFGGDEGGTTPSGEPPHLRVLAWLRNAQAVTQRLILPAATVSLLVLAMHFSQWTFKANHLLERLDDHLATDPYEEIRDLLLVANAIDPPDDGATEDASLPAQKMFDQSMNDLRRYHFREQTLRADTAIQRGRFDPTIAFIEGAKLFFANIFESGNQAPDGDPKDDQGTPVLAQTKSLSTNPGTGVEVVRLGAPQNDAAPNEDHADEPFTFDSIEPALGGRNNFLQVVRTIAEQTGRHPDFAEDHISSRLNLGENANDLQALIANANRFFLPMLYGALGAALYCLVRVLTPSLADLGLGRAALRILFGAFAAMTLSMLFIPANIFSINAQSSSPLIFLACFLFGYSFDSVMIALRRMETIIKGRLRAEKTEA